MPAPPLRVHSPAIPAHEWTLLPMVHTLCRRFCLLLALACIGALLPAAAQTACGPCGQHLPAAVTLPPAVQAAAHGCDDTDAAHPERCCHVCSGALPVAWSLPPLPAPAAAPAPYALARHDSPVAEPPQRPPR